MMDSIVFFSSLIMCISLGSSYKKIEDPVMKRNYGSGLGILTACLICGHYVYHTALMVWGNIIIIKCSNRKYVHQMSLLYTWLYLIYLHMNFSDTFVIWLHQSLALRLVGLAFDMRSEATQKIVPKAATSTDPVETDRVIEPTVVDIISYAYYFPGLHKGPYYRWKAFQDHFKFPFGVLGDCRIITEQKFKKALICGLSYILLRMKFSPQMYYEEQFYQDYGSDLRYLYNIPLLLMFFLYTQCVMMLCTSVFTETGFGVYPVKCMPTPGHGPTVRFSLLNLAVGSPDVALEEEYNFAMLKCFENDKVLLGPRMKHTIRGWDMPTRYWFWSNIYKNLVKSNKEVRSACSFLAYNLWSGPSLQNFIISCTLWVYVHLEAEYSELYDTDGQFKFPWQIGYSIMRLFCLIYLTPCLVVEDSAIVLKYYNSIFWMYHLFLFFLTILSVVIYKTTRRELRPVNRSLPIAEQCT